MNRWLPVAMLASVGLSWVLALPAMAQPPCYAPPAAPYQAPQYFAGSSYAFAEPVSPPVYYNYTSHYPGSNATYYGFYPPSFYSGYPQTTYVNPGPYYYTPTGAYSPSYYSYYYTPGYFRY